MILRLGSFLTARGFPKIKLIFPPVELCTDNAAMIAWTGMEMYENGWESDLSCTALRKVSFLVHLFLCSAYPYSSPGNIIKDLTRDSAFCLCRQAQIYS